MKSIKARLFNAILLGWMMTCWVTPVCSQQQTTPLQQELSEQTLTAVFPPAGDGEWGQYRVWLPEGYNLPENAKRTYPLLLIDHAGGNSHQLFRVFGDWVTRNHWVCVMPTDVRNGPIDKITSHYAAIFPDIKKRFRLTPHCGVMTGHSGGSRRATLYGNKNQDLFGGIISNGGIRSGGAPQVTDNQMMSAVLIGVGDFNIGEINSAIKHLDPKRVQVRMFDGGHSWGPQPLQEEILDWMAAGLLSQSNQPEPVLDLLNVINEAIEATDSKLRRYILMKRYVLLAKSQKSFKKMKDLSETNKQYKAEIKQMSQDKDFAIEIKAMKALQTIRDKRIAKGIGSALSWATSSLVPPLQHGKKVLETTKTAREKATTALENFAELYPDTEALEMSETDAQAIDAFPRRWTK